MIYGKSRVIRDCMLKRGWCEKFYRRNSGGNKSLGNLTTSNRLFYFNEKTEHLYFMIYILHFSKMIIVAADQHFSVESSPVVLLAGIGDLKDHQNECLLISRMLTNHTVDFLWNTGSDWPGWPAQDNKTTVFNRYCRAGFTSKVSLAHHNCCTIFKILFIDIII